MAPGFVQGRLPRRGQATQRPHKLITGKLPEGWRTQIFDERKGPKRLKFMEGNLKAWGFMVGNLQIWVIIEKNFKLGFY